MIGVDLIGDIRRAYFEQKRPIKEIVRALLVSRTTVRRVIGSRKTAFKYERGVTMSQRWVSRSSMAVVILASPNTCGHCANARLVVMSNEVVS